MKVHVSLSRIIEISEGDYESLERCLEEGDMTAFLEETGLTWHGEPKMRALDELVGNDHKTPTAAQYALNNIEKFREAMDEMPAD